MVSQAAKNLKFRESKVEPDYRLTVEGPATTKEEKAQQQQNRLNLANPEDFDIIWFDLAIDADILYKLKPY